MDWRRVRFGILRPKEIARFAKSYSGRNFQLVRKFWEKVEAGSFAYSVKRDVTGLFLAQFYSCLSVHTSFSSVFEFSTREQLIVAAAEFGMAYLEGYDMTMLRQAYDRQGKDIKDHVYLDLSSLDDIKQRPSPMHEHEVKTSPKFEEVKKIRVEAMEKFIEDPDQREYFSQCRNTFDIHAEDSNDPAIVALQVQKFDMLAELCDQDQYQASDDAFDRAVAYSLLDIFDFDADCNAVELSVRFSVSELCMMGCHNSAKGGLSGTVPDKGHTKASMNAVSTLESLKLLKQCSERNQMTIRPHTMNPKDETNKPGKKEKMFNMLDHCNQKLHYLFQGDYTDRHRAKVQSGYMMGISMTSGEMDEAMRLQFGIALGKGRLKDEDLKKLRAIQTDFTGFEYNQDKNAVLCLAWARAIRFGSGVRDQSGNPSRTLKVALAAEFERKVLPDLRIGGLNLTFMTPSIQISGEPDTLTWNEEMHKLMVMLAQWMYNEIVNRFVPEDTPVFESSPKNGDDGLYPDTPYTNEVLDRLSNEHAPVQFKTEKRGTFLSEIAADGTLLNEGVSYCKMNFVLEDGLLTLQRIKENMYKVVVGNKSSYEPRACMQACISQTQNVYGSDLYYNLLKYKFERMEETFGKLSEMGRSGDLDCRDETALDHRLAMDYFPSQDEVKRILYTKDPVKIRQLHNSLNRFYAYNVPAAGIAKF